MPHTRVGDRDEVTPPGPFTANPQWQPPRGIDEHIVPLCKLVNAQPGMRTVGSCSGHGRKNGSVQIEVVGIPPLRRLVEAMGKADRWNLLWVPVYLTIIFQPDVMGSSDFSKTPYLWGLEMVIHNKPTPEQLNNLRRRLQSAFRRLADNSTIS